MTWLQGSMRMQAENRGLKQLVFSSAQGREKVHAMRERMLPLISRVVERAQASGDLRKDFTLQDLPVLSFMVGAVVDFTGPVVGGHVGALPGAADRRSARRRGRAAAALRAEPGAGRGGHGLLAPGPSLTDVQ